MDKNSRHILLKKYTQEESVISELLAYTKNKFISEVVLDPYTIYENSSVETWAAYEKESQIKGVFKTLQSHLIQLQFPVKENISSSDKYRNATLKGIIPEELPAESGLVLQQPESLELKIYDSIGGKIPVLIVPNGDDFRTIIQALAYKNEPAIIPDSMGASIINGINNWHRIHTLKKQWLAENPLGDWGVEFKENIIPNPTLYKDTIIVLSTKSYSNVPASSLRMIAEDWRRNSLQIRLAHECAHLFTLKHYGNMANNMHDELIADYAGIHEAFGRYRPELFLKFIGLEKFPKYRSGGRLENYLGNPPISIKAFDILKIIVKKAVENVSQFDTFLKGSKYPKDLKYRLMSLCSLDLITMASPEGVELLASKYQLINNEDGE